MGEGGVGGVEREALERASTAEIEHRRSYYTRLVRISELDRLGVAHATGDRSTQRLIQQMWLLDAGEAKRLVAEAQDLTPRSGLRGDPLAPRYPATAQVLADGRTGPAQVAIIRRTLARLERCEHVDLDQRVQAEEFLAAKATQLPPRLLGRAAHALLAALDPDGVAPREGENGGDELHVARRRDGTFALRGQFHDPVEAEMFVGVFDTLATPCGPEDRRTREARNAAALKDLLLDALGPGGLAHHSHTGTPNTNTNTAPELEPESESEPGAQPEAAEALIPQPRRCEPGPGPAGSGPAGSGPAGSGPVRAPGRPQITITIDHRWLAQAIGHGTLGSGAFVNPHTVRRWACDSEVIPVVLGSRSEPLDVGRMSRTVTEAIRRALNLRDGGCSFPTCDREPRRCQAHHVDPHWIDGGHTSLQNTTLLCVYHHQLVHCGHWTIRMVDGRPWFTPPEWVDAERKPRPGGRTPVPT